MFRSRPAGRRSRGFATLIAATAGALGVVAIGCSETPSVETSTSTEGVVKGTVTFKGQLATQGKVVFDPSNYARKNVAARSADIQPDGTYQITTLIGQNQVRLEGVSKKMTREDDDMPAFYDVKPGEQTFDIVLPPPAMPNRGGGEG